ncbi:MAG: hypothetical protein M3033_19080 [Acidobacteriota bacterium]|nr:hypothetical protein [Acidobacteriota bacterium]
MENTDKTQPNNATPKGNDKTNTNQTNSAAGKTTNDTQNAQGGKAAGSEITAKIGDALTGDTGALKDVYNSAKESTGAVASQAYGLAAKKATSVIDEQKATLTQGLTSVADSIRQIGDNLRSTEEPTGVAKAAAEYTNTAAEKVEQISGYLEKQDLSGLVKDIKSFAQSNPALFLGGAFTLGILAARFLKSGGSSQSRRSNQSRNKLERSEFADDGVHLPENLDSQGKSSPRSKLQRSEFADDGIHMPENLDSQTKSGKGQSGGGTSANTASQNKGG